MKKQLLKTAVATCALALVGVCNVNATSAALRYSTDGTTWTTVLDNGVGDLLNTAGSGDGIMLVTVLTGTWSVQV